MGQLKKRKSICFLLIIAMLFMGMCFEKIHTDSLFLNNESSKSASIRSCEQLISSEVFCLQEENLRQSSNTESFMRQAVRHSIIRNSRNVDINLLHADILPQYSPISVSDAICGIIPVIFNNLIVAGYIHDKDGKKA